MKNRFLKLFSPLLLMIFLFSAGTVLAADNTSTVQLQLKPFLSGIDAKGYSEVTSSNNPGLAVGFLYKIAMTLVGLVAFGSLVYAGILRTWGAVGSPARIKEADDRIKDTLWGILLLAGAAVIFNTINPRINDVGAIGSEISSQMPVVQTPTTTVYSSFSELVGETYSESAARQQLTTYGIGVKNACTGGQTSGCVSLNGMQVETVAEMINLSTQVGGNNVYVTGGTEGAGTIHNAGVYSHGTGYKFDLNLNTTLTGYITKNYTYIGDRRDGAPQYRAPSGAIYALENNHWDVLVKPAGGTPGA